MITYEVGDATSPGGEGARVVAHVCNDIGLWGAGFVKALSRRWPEPERCYRGWFGGGYRPTPPDPTSPGEMLCSGFFQGGAVQIVRVEPDLYVASMVAQHRVRTRSEPDYVPLRYDWLQTCLALTSDVCEAWGASLHMPRIGAGLAGGDWDRIASIIDDIVTVPVTVYDLP